MKCGAFCSEFVGARIVFFLVVGEKAQAHGVRLSVGGYPPKADVVAAASSDGQLNAVSEVLMIKMRNGLVVVDERPGAQHVLGADDGNVFGEDGVGEEMVESTDSPALCGLLGPPWPQR